MLSIFFIGIALSMDAFSLAVGIGTNKVKKKEKLILVLMIGLMHFIMPQIGLVLGRKISSIFELNIDVLIILLFIYLGTMMLIERKKDNQCIKTSIISLIICAFSVSIDSFSVGLCLNGVTNNYIAASLIFLLCSATISYIGLMIGEYSIKLLKERATLFGAIILYILAIVNIIQHFF